VSHDHYPVSIVSCDILGHKTAEDADQIRRVAAINEIVAGVIGDCAPGDVVWSSGGDGGHVVFRQESWQQVAIGLMRDLFLWSREERVTLRITGHRGIVSHVRGADGRVQLVGRGINYAGWMLTQVSREGMVVSDSFRKAVETHPVEPAAEFHEPRYIPNLEFSPELFFLMSFAEMRSNWVNLPRGDRAELEAAVKEGRAWDILYYAKRLWQVNSVDQKVAPALEGVKPNLRYRDSQSGAVETNPLFGNFGPDELKEILRLGQLVERRRGEVICRYGEAGDTLFTILHGQVGVYHSEGEDFHGTAEPKYVMGPGEIVGELAYALSRNRTAEMVALTDVAMISFSNEELRQRLSHTSVGETALRQVTTFINFRVLQHVSDNAVYLLGPRRTGPLAEGRKSWEDTLVDLRKHCALVTVESPVLELTLDDVVTPASEHQGLHILAAGAVTSPESGPEPLNGIDFPVLWADIPRILAPQQRTYHVVDEPVKVFSISARGLGELEARKREALRRSLRRKVGRAAGKYEFDVYLCHSKRDWPVVSEIHQRMTEAGISCWLDDERIKPGVAVTKTVEDGLRSSRFLMACVSENFARSEWAQRELQAVLHLDVKRRDGGSILLLMLDASADKDEVIPLLLRDVKRVHYTRSGEFADLMAYIVSDGAR